jgi:hypothetical protein
MKAFIGGLIIGGAAVALAYSYLPAPPALEQHPTAPAQVADTILTDENTDQRWPSYAMRTRSESGLWRLTRGGVEQTPDLPKPHYGIVFAPVGETATIVREDIASICVDYARENDILMVELTLVPEADDRLFAYAESLIGPGGFSPVVLAFDSSQNMVGEWFTSTEALKDAARYNEVIPRQPIRVNFNHLSMRDGVSALHHWAENKRFDTCVGTPKARADVLWLLEQFWGKRIPETFMVPVAEEAVKTKGNGE